MGELPLSQPPILCEKYQHQVLTRRSPDRHSRHKGTPFLFARKEVSRYFIYYSETLYGALFQIYKEQKIIL
jgi:hypothetical protein